MTKLNKYQTIEDFDMPVSSRRIKAIVTPFSLGDEFPSDVVIPERENLLLYTEGFPKPIERFSIGLEMGLDGKTKVGSYQIVKDGITETKHSFVIVEPQDLTKKTAYISSALDYFYETPLFERLSEDTRIEYLDTANGPEYPFLITTINGHHLAISLKEVKTNWGSSRVLERKKMLTQALVEHLHDLLDKAHDNDEVNGLRISIYPNNHSDLLDEILSYGLEVVVGSLNISRHPNGSDQYIIRRENDYYVVNYCNKYGFSYIIDALAKLNG